MNILEYIKVLAFEFFFSIFYNLVIYDFSIFFILIQVNEKNIYNFKRMKKNIKKKKLGRKFQI